MYYQHAETDHQMLGFFSHVKWNSGTEKIRKYGYVISGFNFSGRPSGVIKKLPEFITAVPVKTFTDIIYY
jgi:hypothetical protein